MATETKKCIFTSNDGETIYLPKTDASVITIDTLPLRYLFWYTYYTSFFTSMASLFLSSYKKDFTDNNTIIDIYNIFYNDNITFQKTLDDSIVYQHLHNNLNYSNFLAIFYSILCKLYTDKNLYNIDVHINMINDNGNFINVDDVNIFTNEENENNFFEFVISPHLTTVDEHRSNINGEYEIYNHNYNSVPSCKVLLTASVINESKISIWSLLQVIFYIFNYSLTPYDSFNTFQYFRNIEFHIIPCINPSGFNTPCNELTSNEKEKLHIWLDTHCDDAACYIHCQDFEDNNNSDIASTLCIKDYKDDNNYYKNLALSHIQNLTNNIKKINNILNIPNKEINNIITHPYDNSTLYNSNKKCIMQSSRLSINKAHFNDSKIIDSNAFKFLSMDIIMWIKANINFYRYECVNRTFIDELNDMYEFIENEMT